MRLRIQQQPTGTIDGIVLDQFQSGLVDDIPAHLATVFLAEGWAEPCSDVDDAPGVRRPKNALVLVVDDHTDCREITATLLEREGYHVIEALDGRDAMASLCQHVPDLVLLDLNMPVMDGWAFRAEQQHLPNSHLASIPVVLVTAAPDARDHAATLKAVGLIEKPFAPDELLQAVKLALRH